MIKTNPFMYARRNFISNSPADVHTIEYNRNYIRNSIIALLRYKKPVIVTGMLKFNPYEYYYSFINVKPFYPSQEKKLRILCQHVNISKKQIDAVLNLYGNHDYTQEPLVLICKPYVYRVQVDGEDRGGLNLTAELGIPGIMTYQQALLAIPRINKNKYVDFAEFAGGYFIGNSSQENENENINKNENVNVSEKEKGNEDKSLKPVKKETLLEEKIRLKKETFPQKVISMVDDHPKNEQLNFSKNDQANFSRDDQVNSLKNEGISFSMNANILSNLINQSKQSTTVKTKTIPKILSQSSSSNPLLNQSSNKNQNQRLQALNGWFLKI